MKASKPVPFKRTLFVCTHERSDGRVACANAGRGGKELADKLKAAVHAAGLKGKVRVAKSGCLDLCEEGPNAFLYPEGQWFCGLKPEDAAALAKKLAE